MNYLGHALFSGEDPNLLTGNMIGDFIKGRSTIVDFPDTIQRGIRWHRMLDEFTDNHPAIARARNILRPDYGLYSGPIVDVTIDHYLANDPIFFPHANDLFQFAHKVYNTLLTNTQLLPNDFRHMLRYMQQDNWLYEVRSLKGFEQSLSRLVRRMKYENDSTTAYQLVIRHYYEMNQIYYEFIADVENFVKIKLREEQSF